MPLPSWSLCSFDTIDHNILITRLSYWFGIHGSVLSWFKSYLSSPSFRVKCDNNLSSFHTSSCGVPKALFSALYSSSCTLPLTALLSLPFPRPPPLCWWYIALLLFPPTQLWLTKTFVTGDYVGDPYGCAKLGAYPH